MSTVQAIDLAIRALRVSGEKNAKEAIEKIEKLKEGYSQEQRGEEIRSRYGFETQKEWLQCFREQFKKHSKEKGFNSKTYNLMKDAGTPLWMTIAYHCQTSRWNQLMQLADVRYPDQERYDPHREMISVRRSTSAYLERYRESVEKQEILDRQLMELLEKKRQKNKTTQER